MANTEVRMKWGFEEGGNVHTRYPKYNSFCFDSVYCFRDTLGMVFYEWVYLVHEALVTLFQRCSSCCDRTVYGNLKFNSTTIRILLESMVP